MRVGDPAALWLVLAALIALAALLYGHWQRQRTAAAIGDRPVLAPLTAELSPRRRRLRWALWSLAALLFALAALRPQWGARTELARHRGLDVVFALDVSRSMLARDVSPDRLRRAKLEIASLVDQFAGNRIGLIAFAGSAFVQCPLTTDVSAVKMFLNALVPEALPQGGTALAKALAVADRLFAASSARAVESQRQHGQVLVVITDGEDHEGEVAAIAGRLKKRGVVTYAIGVGSEEGEPIPLTDDSGRVTGYLKDGADRPVLTRLSPATLNALAEAAGGQALIGPRIDESLLTVAAEIDRLEKSEFESRLLVQYH
ncbi:MAG: VWA domain-containing protein, partial [Deltaproteobacteria bacterium]|nr:VWA domain-containing protein [Deltaproteobacteria bacterium]